MHNFSRTFVLKRQLLVHSFTQFQTLYCSHHNLYGLVNNFLSKFHLPQPTVQRAASRPTNILTECRNNQSTVLKKQRRLVQKDEEEKA